MCRNIPMALLEPGVFRDVVKVLSAYHQSASHFCGGYDAGEKAAADAGVAGEGAFVVLVTNQHPRSV